MSSKPGREKPPSHSRHSPLASLVAWWAILTRADKLLILGAALFIIGLSAYQFDPSPDGAEVVVEVAAEVFGPYPLSEPRSLRLDGPKGISEVEIREGAARIVAAPCPQLLCVRRGWVRRRGETAVCVPNRLVLRVQGRTYGKGFDMVSR